jgi:TonB family protein
MTREFIFLVLIATISFSAAAQVPEVQECPKPFRSNAQYPPDAIRNNIKGEVIVAGRFDDCGRITEVLIRKKSGNKLIDNAAIDTLKQTVLSESQRSKAVDGYYEMVVSFGIDNNIKIKSVRLDWPKSHDNPHYVVDESTIGFDSVASANKAITESNDIIVRPPVYQFVHRIVQFDSPTGREFWLFLYSKGNATIAARYRPIIENSQPVVKLAILCELEPSQCNGVRDILMRGLPFAKAK